MATESVEADQEQAAREKPDRETISVLGGVDVEVEYRPTGKEKKGRKETVKVRELGADEMLRFNLVIDFPGSTAELYCSKPKGWADTLTRESLKKILKVGDDVGNLKFWSDWRSRQAAIQKFEPGGTDTLEEAIRKALGARSTRPPSRSKSATGSPQSKRKTRNA